MKQTSLEQFGGHSPEVGEVGNRRCSNTCPLVTFVRLRASANRQNSDKTVSNDIKDFAEKMIAACRTF